MLNCLPRIRHLAILGASTLALTLAVSAARAQDSDRYGNDGGYYSQTGEQVEVTAPRYHPRTGEYGAPIRDVAMSRDVRFDDLDLNTAWGARKLRQRIDFTARALCRQMDAMYPVATSDSPPCYRTAVENAMVQANAAIDDAREVARND